MRQRGFTYLAVLFLVALMGLALTGIATVWHTAAQREKERDLLYVGKQFRLAIESYYEGSPGALKKYPPNLEELLKDSRFPGIRRHLRRIYRDPVGGGSEWGLVPAPEGGIMGVHSLSADAPLKRGNFREAERGLADKGRYADWQFVYRPAQPNPAQPKTKLP